MRYGYFIGALLLSCGQLAPVDDGGSDAGADGGRADVELGFGDAAYATPEASFEAPDASRNCVGVTCDPATQYCFETGLATPTHGECRLLPAPCANDVTCACLVDAGAGACGCYQQDGGLLVSPCLDP